MRTAPPASRPRRTRRDPVDTQTRHALKGDKFAQATVSGFSWLSGHKSGVLRWVVSVAAIIILLGGGLAYWNMRSAAADVAMGAALDVYTAPLAQPGAPPETGVYASAGERSKVANQKFVGTAKD